MVSHLRNVHVTLPYASAQIAKLSQDFFCKFHAHKLQMKEIRKIYDSIWEQMHKWLLFLQTWHFIRGQNGLQQALWSNSLQEVCRISKKTRMANGAAIYVDLATASKTIDALKSLFAKLIVGVVSQQNSLDVFMTKMEAAQQATTENTAINTQRRYTDRG